MRSISQRVRNRFNLSVAEVGGWDRWQFAVLGLSAVGSDAVVVRRVVGLLREAGFTKKDEDGVLMKGGRRLEFDYLYIHPSAEYIFTTIQEYYRKYGVKMNLKLISPSAWSKVLDKKDFESTYIYWGSTSATTRATRTRRCRACSALGRSASSRWPTACTWDRP